MNKMAWDNASSQDHLDFFTKTFRANLIGRILSLCDYMQSRFSEVNFENIQIENPVFIIGHWRSGTTYLHNLLCSDPQFSFPSTANCMQPHAFLLHSGQTSGLAIKRPMDDVLITANSPQEDEFALLGLGARSPYEALLFPQRLETAFDLADPEDLTPDERRLWTQKFLFFTRGISFLGGNRQIVLKSPTHSYRIRTILKLFPTAKFILISRHPFDVFESTFRMWRSLFKIYALGQNISENNLRNFILKNRIKMELKISESKAEMNDKNLLYVNYEDILKNPHDQINRIYTYFKLGKNHITSKPFHDHIMKSKNYVPHRQRPPEQWKRRIEDAWSDYF